MAVAALRGHVRTTLITFGVVLASKTQAEAAKSDAVRLYGTRPSLMLPMQFRRYSMQRGT